MYVLEDTGDSGGGGTNKYSDLEEKPLINGVELDGNKTSQDLGVYSKPSGGIPQSDLSSDVQSQLNKHFKGWYNTLAELKAAHTATDGDSAYVKDASPATTWSIYVYDSTASSDNYWADSGTDADTTYVQTFASGEEVNEISIDNDFVGGADKIAGAKEVKNLNTFEEIIVDGRTVGEISNGTIKSDFNLYTDMAYQHNIIINEGYIHIEGVGSSYNGRLIVGFYSDTPSSSTIIPNTGIAATTSFTDTQFSLDVPNGTRYIVVVNYKPSETYPCTAPATCNLTKVITTKEKINEVDTNLRETNNIVDSLNSQIFGSYELDLTTVAEAFSKTVIKTTGEVASGGGAYTTYKITNQNYNRVYGAGSTFAGQYFKLAFYNGEPSASTLISGIGQRTSYVPEEFDVIVPEGTVYILYCNYNNNNDHQNTPECYTNIEYSKIQKLENTVDGYSSQISSISETANSAITEANECKEVIDDFVIKNEPIVKTVADDLTITGYYKNDTASGMDTGFNYKSFPLINVSEGKKVYFHNWKEYTTPLGVCWCYDNDGLPYNGSIARIYSSSSLFVLISTSEAGAEYEFTVPTNCSQLGISISPTYPENAYVVVGEEYYEFTEEAIDMINSVVDVDIENIGDRAANYYLKGNSNILPNNKKLGIIAAGQSNIDGRNSYSDYPYLSNNPNTKVHICKNTNGTFSDFEVTDGGSNNDWGFDAIVYNLLTETSYGNQDEIYVMKKSMGGTSIDIDGATDYHWTADYEYINPQSHSLLRSFESIIRKAVELQGSNFEIKAFLWHQGEGDAGQTKEVADRYYENLKNMLAYVRGVVGNPRLHFFCGTISKNNHADAYIDIVNAAYWQLASEDPYFHCVDMSNAVLEDTWHFNYQWSIYFGQKVYDMMIDAGIISGTKINPSEPT